MKTLNPICKVLAGDPQKALIAPWQQQPIDITRLCTETGYSTKRTTIKSAISITSRSTFNGKNQSTLTLKPTDKKGWWIKRTDLPEELPIEVCPGNVRSANANIVLRSGSPENYLKMVEHIIAFRQGYGIDDLLLEIPTGDPPLFDRSSLDIAEAIEKVGICEKPEDATYISVREPVSIIGHRGEFVTILPPENGSRILRLDVAIDWDSIIGKERILFDLTYDTFRYAAGARTNATHKQMLLARLFGLFNPALRKMGYTTQNILIHGKNRYYTTPRPEFTLQNRSFEPVWHRACLDLLAAISLLRGGRFIGTIISYKAGHLLDARFMKLLELYQILS